LLNKTGQKNIMKYQKWRLYTKLLSQDYMKLLDLPLGKVELSSVVASNSDDIEPTMTASGASLSSTSIFVTSPINKCFHLSH